jgi:tetratricopeptide (TPR) repeat protein
MQVKGFSWVKFVHALVPAVIITMTVAALYSSLQNGFVDYDDGEILLNNSHYRGLGWAQLRWMFTTFHMGHYQPLTWVTLGLDYLIWGMEPFGYHLTNLILHSATAVIFYFVALRVLSRALSLSIEDLSLRIGAGISALLFAVHPLRVESVAWVTERRDVLSGLFFLLTLLCYLRGAASETRAGHLKWMVVAALVYVLSLLSKSIGMSLPVVLLVLDVYPLRRLGWGERGWLGRGVRWVWLEKIPFLLLAVAAASVAWVAQYQTGSMASYAQWDIIARLAVVSYGLVFYLWKTVVPLGLSPLYEWPRQLNPGDWRFVLSELAVVEITFLLFFFRRQWPAGLAVWVCYVAIVAPVSGIAQSGPQLVADRYSYLSCLSWAILVGGGLIYLCRRWFAHRQAALALAGACLVSVVIGLGYLTREQVQVWHDTERLWRHVLSITPESSIAHNDLGNILSQRGQLEEAVNHFRQALQIKPTSATHFNFGNALASLGRIDEAIDEYRQSVRISPGFVKAHYNFAVHLASQGKLEEAIDHYRQVIQLDPTSVKAHNNLGVILAGRGKLDEALEHYREAIRIDPAFVEARNNLGLILARRGRLDEAIEHYREALKVKPDYALAHANLADALTLRGEEVEEAIEYYRRAIEINPRSAVAHYNWGNALLRRKDVGGAIEHYRRALNIDPRYAAAHFTLGLSLGERGDAVGAIEHFRRVVQLNPGSAEGHYYLGRFLAETGQATEAARQFKEALRIQPAFVVKSDPSFALAHYNMGNDLLKVGEIESAIEQYRQAVKSDPGYAEARSNLGNALEARGEMKEAIEQYKRAVEINPGFAVAHYNLANALLKGGDFESAREHYRRAIEINPRYVEARTNFGLALDQGGEKEEAIAQYRKALEIDPRSAAAHYNLGLLLVERGDMENGIKHFREATKINPRDAEAHYNLGRSLALVGKVDEAAGEFKEAVRIEPGFGLARRNLEQLLAPPEMEKAQKESQIGEHGPAPK